MGSKDNTCNHLELDEIGAEVSEASLCGEGRTAGPEEASKFAKGLVLALPLSISLWAAILIGLRAIL